MTGNYDAENEFEAQHGLPENLPEDEKILWQGSPNFALLMNKVFLFRLIAIYFFCLLSFVLYWDFQKVGQVDALFNLLTNLLLSGFSLAALALLAYLTCSTAVYTLTNKRVVMRIGIVLTLTFNIPFKQIVAADYKKHSNGSGDISFRIDSSTKIAFIQLWPHCRFKSFAHPEPAMKCIENADDVAFLVHQAWKKHRETNDENSMNSNASEKLTAKSLNSSSEVEAA
jgi:hypothetical protein